jgi:hypothetical protein
MAVQMIYYLNVHQRGKKPTLLTTDHPAMKFLTGTHSERWAKKDGDKIYFDTREAANYALQRMTHTEDPDHKGKYTYSIVPHGDVNLELFIRVLTNQQRSQYSDDDLKPHLKEISERYSELKGVNGFEESALIARMEWAKRFLKTRPLED